MPEIGKMILLSKAARCIMRAATVRRNYKNRAAAEIVRRQAPFQNLRRSAVCRLIKIQTTFHYIVADPESRNA